MMNESTTDLHLAWAEGFDAYFRHSNLTVAYADNQYRLFSGCWHEFRRGCLEAFAGDYAEVIT